MKKKSFKPTLRCLLPCASLCAALAAGTPLWAQSTSTPQDAATTPTATRVGDSTHSLLQRQREGREASATPRPIDGRVAELNHQRYLKSFETPLPEWFDSKLKSK
ncbi:DUF3613 domain-containing protein [Hydrogenophaga sp. 2FB]|uniref:DUF3613 domain-containing protein n=1 Tax=Hydrogenophaga sp. 2FB TaxID=2502187 RepID=UPI0010F681AC|nr:DUF3613 domain-containing protein [Hydrogenophaga sp. 2FB]